MNAEAVEGVRAAMSRLYSGLTIATLGALAGTDIEADVDLMLRDRDGRATSSADQLVLIPVPAPDAPMTIIRTTVARPDGNVTTTYEPCPARIEMPLPTGNAGDPSGLAHG